MPCCASSSGSFNVAEYVLHNPQVWQESLMYELLLLNKFNFLRGILLTGLLQNSATDEVSLPDTSCDPPPAALFQAQDASFSIKNS
jgi:hypothetical protein